MVSALKAIFEIETSIWALALAAGLLGQLWCLIRKGATAEMLWRAFAWIHQELWIAAPVGALVQAVEHWHRTSTMWLVFFDMLTLINWWRFRDWPDENRWKRRGKKLRDAVKVRAGRLVVVPVGAS